MVPASCTPRRGAACGRAVKSALPVSDLISSARIRQAEMIADNVGFNFSPLAWDAYPTIGRSGTFVSDRQAVSSYFGNISGQTEVEISGARAAQIEQDMGLVPGARIVAEGGNLAPSAISDLRAISATEANAPFLAKGWSAPYDAGSHVRTFTTNQEIIFVRVSTVENPQGAFLVRASEVEGMTPTQIQQHLALPKCRRKLPRLQFLQAPVCK